MNHRTWTCLLAGGNHHGKIVSKVTDASLTFPPSLSVDGELYHPMTMTSATSAGPEWTGSCVMAHCYATLEQVNDAHRLLLLG